MKEYAIYKGENMLFVGDVRECAEHLGVEKKTVYYYSSPAYKRRIERRNAKNYVVAVRLDDE